MHVGAALQEQRLRYLKQQERRQQQAVSESEKLQRLKERVESQEAKLKKIRAMRGQVDYSKVINGNLCKLEPRPHCTGGGAPLWLPAWLSVQGWNHR